MTESGLARLSRSMQSGTLQSESTESGSTRPLGSMQSGTVQSEAMDPGLDEAAGVDAVGDVAV